MISQPRQCNLSFLSELATFHVFFDSDHLPATIPDSNQVLGGGAGGQSYG